MKSKVKPRLTHLFEVLVIVKDAIWSIACKQSSSFTVFDHDDKGYIEVQELGLALKCLRLSTTEEELTEMLEKFEGNMVHQ